MSQIANIIIEITVFNHPGVLSHISGLFSRRSFNLEGVLCSPIGDGLNSRMYLLVCHENKLEQIVKQLEKLHDVKKVIVREDYDHTAFNRIHDWVEGRVSDK